MSFIDNRRDEGFGSKVMGWIKRMFIAIGVMTTISIIFFSISLSQMLKADEEPALPDNIVLTYTIKSGLIEKVTKPSLSQPLLRPSTTLSGVTKALADGAKDKRVKGFVARINDIDMTPAQVQELRDAVIQFRKSGKFAAVFATDMTGMGSTNAYYLSTAFDQIWLQPVGQIAVNGVSIEIPFAKSLMDKIGVQADMLHKGAYKSAPETFTETEMSAPHREMMIGLITDLSDQIMAGIAESRKLTPDQVRQLVNYAPYTDADALRLKLIDKVGYYDQLTDSAKAQAGSDAKLVQLQGYADAANKDKNIVAKISSSVRKDKSDVKKPKIALIIGTGSITSTTNTQAAMGGSGMAADKIVAAFKAAEEDKNVMAVVFRIDSPGGSPSAAESIRHAIMKIQKSGKPVIVSMGGYAASGGYWVATPADKIIAQPATVTGSIGVFGGKVVLADLWDKIGVRWQAVSAGDNARMWSPNTPFSAKEKERFNAMLDNIYESFIVRVMEGRKLTREQVLAAAEGRVWTGRQAKERGLVDDLGGLDKAVIAAKTAAKLPLDQDIPVVNFPRRQSPLDMVLQMMLEGVSVTPMVSIDAEDILRQVTAKTRGELLEAPQIEFH